MPCREVAAGDNYTLAVAVKIIQPSGADRAVLLAVSASDNTAATPPEMATSATNRKMLDSSESASITLTSGDATEGDYLVVELGFRQASTSVNSGTLLPLTTSATDLPEDDTDVTGTKNGWIEFSADITYKAWHYASSATPEDGSGTNTNTADPTAVTPPSGMLAGDLVCMIGQQRATGATLAITEAGGQSWTSETAIGITNQTDRLFWATFDGTWDADPSVDFGATTCNSVQMHVFRPPSTGYTWSVNQALAETEDASSPYANAGQTTTGTDPTVSLVGWFTADDNDWSVATGNGWEAVGTAQYRNQSGSDQSASYAAKIQATAGATGSVSKTQVTITGDACTTFIITLAATAPSSALAGPINLTFTPAGTLAGSGALAGSCTLSISPAAAIQGHAPILGSATLSFAPTGTMDALASAAGTITVSLAPAGTMAGAGALAGSSTASFAPAGVLLGDAPLLAGSATVSFAPAGTVTGAAPIAGSLTVSFAPSSTMLGAGALAGSGTVTFTPAGTVVGAGALLGTSTLTLSPTGIMAGAGALSGSGLVSFAPVGDLVAEGADDLAGTADITFAPVGALAASGELAGTSTAAFTPSALLSGSGDLAGSSQVAFTPSGSIVAFGDLSGIASLSFTPQGVLLADGALAGPSVLAFLNSGTLAASGALAGSSAVSFDPTGTLISEVEGDIAGTISLTFTLTGELDFGLVPRDPFVPGGRAMFIPPARDAFVPGARGTFKPS